MLPESPCASAPSPYIAGHWYVSVLLYHSLPENNASKCDAVVTETNQALIRLYPKGEEEGFYFTH